MPANNGNSRWLNQSRYRSLSSFPKQGRNNDDARFVSGVSNVMLALPACSAGLYNGPVVADADRFVTTGSSSPLMYRYNNLMGSCAPSRPFFCLSCDFSIAGWDLSLSPLLLPSTPHVTECMTYHRFIHGRGRKRKEVKRRHPERERECLLFLSVDDVVSFSFNPKNTCYNQMGNRLGPLRHRIFTTTDENHTEEDPQHEWTTNGHFSAEIRSLLFFNCNQSDIELAAD